MQIGIRRLVLVAALVLSFGVVGCSDSDEGSGDSGGERPEMPMPTPEPAPELSCAEVASEALRSCLGSYGAAVASCYSDDGAPCAGNDAAVNAATSDLETAVRDNCADGDFLSLSADALVGRLKNSCSSEASSLAWRTYGGPQGAVYPSVDGTGQSCLTAAHVAASSMVDQALAGINACLASGDCGSVEQDRSALAATMQSDVEAACDDLSSLIAVTPETYVARSAHQIDCITATGQPDTTGVNLNCGPSNTDFDAPRGEYKQIIVDGDKWGSLCGDGSDFAFQVRLAPEGEPLDRILIGLQGGGVCLFGNDCSARFNGNPGLFTAMDDEPFSIGIASTDPEISPFANWTKIYLPYCNQDVFAGGGVVEEFDEISIPRYGGVNLRAAVQMTRDVVWKLMDEEGDAGFRPDEIVALFGGWSAGGYGTLYNYHWLLDDLQWPRTAAFPDAGLALDNGSVLGVSGLGDVKIPAWGTLQNLPSYCFDGQCAVGPTLYNAISPRLKQVPEQQMLILSNPKDNTQQNDAFFDDEAFWINTLRQSYCDTKDLNGIQYYFTSVSDESVHVVSLGGNLWLGEVDGEVMADWFWRAITDPDTVEDRAEEGDFVTAIPGVEPYPCEVAP
ncbi:MAG: pectin acetylesterase-family hydrolase [Candidatus Binatia bacterium]|nr:pectin acetylesterase-family hydrolase [Candidatus Binatia bacterium]